MSPEDMTTFGKLAYSVDQYLRAKGLEVVGTHWQGQTPEGGYLVLTVKRVVAPPLAPCAHCEHAQAIHENNGAGACLGIDCACEVYCPPLGEGN